MKKKMQEHNHDLSKTTAIILGVSKIAIGVLVLFVSVALVLFQSNTSILPIVEIGTNI